MNWQPSATSARARAEGQKILIIGTGRSGTHWLGHILQSHPGIHVTVEAPPIFNWATEMALDPRKQQLLMPQLVRQYQLEHAAVAPRHYADKSHPNIWQAEELAQRLPDAVFLGIQRNPFATVASMLKHAGVLGWHERWREFPVPNRFLGITRENAATYDALPPAAKCAYRWRSHAERMAELPAALGERLHVIAYEELIREPKAAIARITAFLRLTATIPPPAIKAESLDRWQRELSPDVQQQIATITGVAAESWAR
jgi:hypothetical protein